MTKRLRPCGRYEFPRAVAAICETLDGRLLLSSSALDASSATAAVSNGVLEVTATAEGERIGVGLSGSDLVVNDNASMIGSFAKAGLKGIHILDDGGDDTLRVSSSVTLQATLRASGGDDSLAGGGGDNLLVGGGGDNSVLRGGGGTSELIPGKAAVATSSGGDHDTLIGGTGFSVADFTRRTDPLYLSNDGNPDSGDKAQGQGIEIMPDVSGIFGGQGNSTVIGTTAGQVLSGGDGNNLIVGAGADNLLIGGGGSNIFVAPVAPVSIFGRRGVNILYINTDDLAEDVISVSPSTEFIDPTAPSAPTVPSAALAPAILAPADAPATVTAKLAKITQTVGTQTFVSTILKIAGTTGDDSISVSMSGADLVVMDNGNLVGSFPAADLKGKQGGVRITGNGGNDTMSIDSSVTEHATIKGGSGNDCLEGGGGACVLTGNGGNDTLVGGANLSILDPGNPHTFSSTGGNDLLMGGSGPAIADFADRTDDLSLSNDGNPDSGDASEDEAVTIMPSVTDILGGTGDDTIVGTVAGVFLSGGGGNNSIHGGGVGDVLIGGTGSDTVAVAGEPVVLVLADGLPCQYSGVSDPAEDVLELDSNDVLV